MRVWYYNSLETHQNGTWINVVNPRTRRVPDLGGQAERALSIVGGATLPHNRFSPRTLVVLNKFDRGSSRKCPL